MSNMWLGRGQGCDSGKEFGKTLLRGVPEIPKTSSDTQRQINVGSSRSPRKPSNEMRREGQKRPERQSNAFTSSNPHNSESSSLTLTYQPLYYFILGLFETKLHELLRKPRAQGNKRAPPLFFPFSPYYPLYLISTT